MPYWGPLGLPKLILWGQRFRRPNEWRGCGRRTILNRPRNRSGTRTVPGANGGAMSGVKVIDARGSTPGPGSPGELGLNGHNKRALAVTCYTRKSNGRGSPAEARAHLCTPHGRSCLASHIGL